MTFTNMFDEAIKKLAGSPTNSHTTVRFPDLDSPPGAAGAAPNSPEGGYFQVRLTEMYLSDARRWSHDIVPATFVLADFNYDGKAVSLPFFVSSAMLKGVPESVDARTLRVRFSDTLVVSPTPYAGGDVSLFVGLFQTTLTDLRKGIFSLFEKLLGTRDLGLISQYVKIADKISSEISEFLFGGEVQCLLGERLPIGKNEVPPSGYIAFLRSKNGRVNTEGLTVRDRSLQRNVGGKFFLIEDCDYCLVQIERLATRNDYTSMDFHRTWIKARGKMLECQHKQAQALMLECGSQILASPDLTEDHKVSLIQFYQAKLLATKDLLPALDRSGATSMGAGAYASADQLRSRALSANKFDSPTIARSLEQVVSLTSKLRVSAAMQEPGEVDIASHLAQDVRRGFRPDADELMRALAFGSVTV